MFPPGSRKGAFEFCGHVKGAFTGAARDRFCCGFCVIYLFRVFVDRFGCEIAEMITGPIIAEIAALVGDPARATILSALLDGGALAASELAFAARITPQTASTHLAKLTEAGLLSVVRNGRHHYFRLASPTVADMIDGIVAVALQNAARV